MFRELNTKQEKHLKDFGSIHYKIDKTQHKKLSELGLKEITHTINYVTNGNIFGILEFELTYVGDLFLMNNLRLKQNGIGVLSEPLLYFFLDLIFKKAQSWASISYKKEVAIESSLSHSSELFVENGYEVEAYKKKEKHKKKEKDCFFGTKKV